MAETAQIMQRVLKPVKATPEALEGYGYLIGEPDDSVREKINFYGADVVVTQPAKFYGNDDLCLNLAGVIRTAAAPGQMDGVPHKAHPDLHPAGGQAFLHGARQAHRATTRW